MDAHPTQIAQDEADWREGGTCQAQQRVLRMRFEGNAVVK
jgi:hypothetical protein